MSGIIEIVGYDCEGDKAVTHHLRDGKATDIAYLMFDILKTLRNDPRVIRTTIFLDDKIVIEN